MFFRGGKSVLLQLHFRLCKDFLVVGLVSIFFLIFKLHLLQLLNVSLHNAIYYIFYLNTHLRTHAITGGKEIQRLKKQGFFILST